MIKQKILQWYLVVLTMVLSSLLAHTMATIFFRIHTSINLQKVTTIVAYLHCATCFRHRKSYCIPLFIQLNQTLLINLNYYCFYSEPSVSFFYEIYGIFFVVWIHGNLIIDTIGLDSFCAKELLKSRYYFI